MAQKEQGAEFWSQGDHKLSLRCRFRKTWCDLRICEQKYFTVEMGK